MLVPGSFASGEAVGLPAIVKRSADWSGPSLIRATSGTVRRAPLRTGSRGHGPSCLRRTQPRRPEKRVGTVTHATDGRPLAARASKHKTSTRRFREASNTPITWTERHSAIHTGTAAKSALQAPDKSLWR